MHPHDIESFAEEITGIFRHHRLDRTGTGEIRNLTLDQAYDVQENFLAGRLAQGERAIGYKVGCTSPAIRTQFGLSEPICGRLMFPQIYADGVKLDTTTMWIARLSRSSSCTSAPIWMEAIWKLRIFEKPSKQYHRESKSTIFDSGTGNRVRRN